MRDTLTSSRREVLFNTECLVLSGPYGKCERKERETEV